MKQERKDLVAGKKVHGMFSKSVKDVAGSRSNDWLKSGYLGKATESFICAVQEEVLLTRWRQARLHGEDVDPKCRVCGMWDETVRHVVAGCGELAKKQYMGRHDRMGTRVHWELCRKYGIEFSERWYEHVPERVVMDRDKRVEIYWDQTIVGATALEHNRPDVVVVDKRAGKWTLVDFSVPKKLFLYKYKNLLVHSKQRPGYKKYK